MRPSEAQIDYHLDSNIQNNQKNSFILLGILLMLHDLFSWINQSQLTKINLSVLGGENVFSPLQFLSKVVPTARNMRVSKAILLPRKLFSTTMH